MLLYLKMLMQLALGLEFMVMGDFLAGFSVRLPMLLGWSKLRLSHLLEQLD